MRKKPAGFSLEKFPAENSSRIYARVNVFAISPILSPGSWALLARNIPRAPVSSALYERALSRPVPKVIYPTSLVVFFRPPSCSISAAASRTRIFCDRELACGRALRSSRSHERMIAPLIGRLTTRKRHGNTISVRERSTLINMLRVPRSRQVARSCSSWRLFNLRLVTDNKHLI